MTILEDTRQLIQDFLASELRAIGAQLTAIDVRLDAIDKRLDHMEARLDRMDARFDKLDEQLKSDSLRAEARINDRFDRAERDAEARQATLIKIFRLDERMQRLEQRELRAS